MSEELQPGETVCLKGTDQKGTVTGKFSDDYYWVKFKCYSNTENKFRPTEIERAGVTE